ncbi:hypothetical protein SAMN05421819_2291 [Bryocella elongata]|uniref:Glycoamylase-like domain-containing protein n=1 Tax=Bryocella elongata TaxID=863522 RepID=A0A1H5YFU5_9BACT|nr:hypothetical protein SAMN05421819_2291 [Bryocella elongata]
MHRRQALQLIAAAGVGAALPSQALRPHTHSQARLSPQDEAFLDDLERSGSLFFVEQCSPTNGQVLDRALWATDGKLDKRRMTSIAATGFGLSALSIADARGYLPHAKILEQVRRTLRFHANELPHEHGFYYHFNDIGTGARWSDVELSSIDTALLLCGVLTARAHFHKDTEIVDLATKIYNRVDWPWMLNGGDTFSMGWKPAEKGKPAGFLDARWAHYCELMMINLLALGSPTHPVDPATWSAWTRPRMHFDGFDYISSNDPIFVHQYSHAYFDFRGKRDAFTNYFDNSVIATKAHKAFCLGLGKPYTDDYWGISASDYEGGYSAWGGPGSQKPDPTPADIAKGFGPIDGSVVPNAAAGSLPFVPGDCLHVLRALKDEHGAKAWGRYGFCDAFHPQAGWYDTDVLGIDQGISLLMAENLRSAFVWETFAKNPEVGVALRRAGFAAV